MPKVLGYTPTWLARPSPGYELFTPAAPKIRSTSRRIETTGVPRTLAARDSEIFVAVGNELRWADLAQLKEEEAPRYRTLKVSIPLPIERLTISPDGDYLAVSTSHTVHVVALPDSSLLATEDIEPIRPKSFQVGPTAHVLEDSPIACVLWHPLGYRGRCLVTVSRAGVVRLWEVNKADRLSFSEPTLSIDLEKLANAQSDADDLGASKYGVSKGFSADAADLEVVTACFGDFPDQEGVHGWAPMTLWIGTIGGDVWALCPLLPSKWQVMDSADTATLLQTLTSSIHVNHADVTGDDNATPDERATAEKQLSWLSDIVYQEPIVEESPLGDAVAVYSRPPSVPAIPLLQGPFSITPELDDMELSDMTVYSLKTLSDGSDVDAVEGLPAAIICLLSDTCQVHVCFDLEGVVGKWLPSEKDDYEPTPTEHDLIVAETIELVKNTESSDKQSITQDVHTDFSFFVTHKTGVYYISLESWIRDLERELSEGQGKGADFRLKRLLGSAETLVEQCVQRQPDDQKKSFTASIAIEDGNIGYLLLNSVGNEPQAVVLDAPEEGAPTEEELAEFMKFEGPLREVREAWQPSKELWQPLNLHAAVDISNRHKASAKEEIRLSPANLEILMSAHRALSAHTDRLQYAVSDLFNRCQRLQDEFHDQIWRTAQLRPKVQAATGDEGFESGSDSPNGAGLHSRLDKVKARQEELSARYSEIRRKMASVEASTLSEKEEAYLTELQSMETSIDSDQQTLTADVDGTEQPAWQRFDKVKEFQASLTKQAEAAMRTSSNGRSAAPVNVPPRSRKQENEQVQTMLQHQTELLEATISRLNAMGVATPRIAYD